MKKGLSVIALLFVFLLIGCNSDGKSDKGVIYDYDDSDTELSDELKAKIGDWVKVGVECYGVLVSIDGEGLPQVGMPLRAQVIRIRKDEIKMKSLENVMFGPQEGCTKMGISSGETWWEKEGDLFQTKEEAEEFLRKLGILEE